MCFVLHSVQAVQAGVPRLALTAMRVSTDASSWDAGAASHTLQSLDIEGLVEFWPTPCFRIPSCERVDCRAPPSLRLAYLGELFESLPQDAAAGPCDCSPF